MYTNVRFFVSKKVSAPSSCQGAASFSFYHLRTKGGLKVAYKDGS